MSGRWRDVPVDAEHPSESGFRPFASLAFWCCLAVSAAIFATVFLAPRLRTWRDLQREYDGRQRELIASERQVDYLQKVVEALRHDLQFAAELARVDFGVSGSEERIPVAPALNLSGEPTLERETAQAVARPFPQNLLDTTLIDTLSDDRSIRASLLGAASLLVLVAFTLLCDTRPRLQEIDPVRWRTRCRRWFAERYAGARD
jgi:hypothetical protein